MFKYRLLMTLGLLGYACMGICQNFSESEVNHLKKVITERLNDYAKLLPTLESQIDKKQIRSELKSLYPNGLLSDVAQLDFLLQPTKTITENQYASARAFFKKIGEGLYKKLELGISEVAPNKYNLPTAIALSNLPGHVRGNIQRRDQKIKRRFRKDKIFTSVLSFEQSIAPSLGKPYLRNEAFLIYWLVDSSKGDWIRGLKPTDIRIIGLEPFNGQFSDYAYAYQASKTMRFSLEEKALIKEEIEQYFLPSYLLALDSIPEQPEKTIPFAAKFYTSLKTQIDAEIPMEYRQDTIDVYSWEISSKAYLELLARQTYIQHSFLNLEMAEHLSVQGEWFVWVARATLVTRHTNDSVVSYRNQLDLNFAVRFKRKGSLPGFTDFKIAQIVRRNKYKTLPKVVEKILVPVTVNPDDTNKIVLPQTKDQIKDSLIQPKADSLAIDKVLHEIGLSKCQLLLDHISGAIRHQEVPIIALSELFYPGQDSIEVYNCNRPQEPIRSYPLSTYFRNLIKSIPQRYYDVTFFYPQPIQGKVYEGEGMWKAEIQFSHYFLGLSKAGGKKYEDFTVKKMDIIIKKVNGDYEVFLGKIQVVKTDCLQANKDRA